MDVKTIQTVNSCLGRNQLLKNVRNVAILWWKREIVFVVVMKSADFQKIKKITLRKTKLYDNITFKGWWNVNECTIIG